MHPCQGCYVMVVTATIRYGSVQIVHVTGLQTRTGIRVWVRWVRVRVEFKVPAQNPYPYGGFGGYVPDWVSNYLPLLILHKQSHVNTINNGDSDVRRLLPFYPILSPPPLDYLYWTTFTRVYYATTTTIPVPPAVTTNESPQMEREPKWCDSHLGFGKLFLSLFHVYYTI